MARRRNGHRLRKRPGRTRDIAHPIRAAIEGYALPLVRLLGESYGPDCMQQAWHEFRFQQGSPFTGDDAHSELFFSWLFHTWSPASDKGLTVIDPSLYNVRPTQAYLTRNSSKLDPLLQRYLQSCLETPLGFYDIAQCRPGIGFRAQNVLTGLEHDMLEALASASLHDGDIIFARILLVDGISMMDAISPISFPPSFRTLLQRADVPPRKLYFELLETYFGAQLPEVRNSGGSILVGTLTK
jgi:hypothetical protein